MSKGSGSNDKGDGISMADAYGEYADSMGAAGIGGLDGRGGGGSYSGPSPSSPAGGAQAAGGFSDGSRGDGGGKGSGPSPSSPAGGAQAAGGYTDGSRGNDGGGSSYSGPSPSSPAGGAQAAGGWGDGSRGGDFAGPSPSSPAGGMQAAGGYTDGSRGLGVYSGAPSTTGMTGGLGALARSAEDYSMAKHNATESLLGAIMAAEAQPIDPYNGLVNGKNLPTHAALTDMTIAEVQEFQNGMVAKGYPSTAVGAFQITQDTLAEQAKRAGLNPETTQFTPSVQKSLALGLVDERARQATTNGILDQDEFDLNLAKEWAGLATKSGKSYYSGVGTNNANVDYSTVANLASNYASQGLTTPTNLTDDDIGRFISTYMAPDVVQSPALDAIEEATTLPTLNIPNEDALSYTIATPTVDLVEQALAPIDYNLGPARPNQPSDDITSLVQEAVTDVLGPEYTIVATSGTEDPGKQHGSNRHGTGLAVDFAIIDPNGRQLSVDNLEDRGKMIDVGQAIAAKSGAQNGPGAYGLGFGTGYMGGSHIHADVTTPGAGQSNTWGSTANANAGLFSAANAFSEMPASFYEANLPGTMDITLVDRDSGTPQATPTTPDYATPVAVNETLDPVGYTGVTPSTVAATSAVPAAVTGTSALAGPSTTPPTTTATPAQEVATTEEAETPGRTLGQQIAATGIDIAAGMIPGAGIFAGLFNAGAQLTGNPTIGQHVVDLVGNAELQPYQEDENLASNASGRDEPEPDRIFEVGDGVGSSDSGTERIIDIYLSNRPTPREKWGRRKRDQQGLMAYA